MADFTRADVDTLRDVIHYTINGFDEGEKRRIASIADRIEASLPAPRQKIVLDGIRLK